MHTHDPFRTIYAAAQVGRLLRAAGLGLIEFQPVDRGGRRVANGLRGRWIEAAPDA